MTQLSVMMAKGKQYTGCGKQ